MSNDAASWRAKRAKKRARSNSEDDDWSAAMSQVCNDNGNDNDNGNGAAVQASSESGSAVGVASRIREQRLKEEEEFLARRQGKNRSLKQTREEEEMSLKAKIARQKAIDESRHDEGQVETLLDAAASLQEKNAQLSLKDQAVNAQLKQEERILKEASHVSSNALTSVKDSAAGIVFTDSMPSSWQPPKSVLAEGGDDGAGFDEIRKKWHILIEGEDVPPPIRSFAGMKFPASIVSHLKSRNINRPTPIQMQGLPVALAGRDMVGIAFTGSGKTVTFTLPMVMIAIEEELRQPLVGGEGPTGLCLAPSRELARQTFDVLNAFCNAVKDSGGVNIRSTLLIGGEDKRQQLAMFNDVGVHCVVATPGRLRDFLGKKSIMLDNCRYICLDEADRMLDMGFDEEVGEIMNHFKFQKQTLLFSATFPKKFQDFAKETLVRPIVVNVGRAGAANLDVIQEVEYVKQEAKIVYLLECLQKTAPPVCIFCERKGDVDDIHEYLLLKGVQAVSIHGGKGQEERNESIRRFKLDDTDPSSADVLVSTDIAAKGLDFPDIQHVINFDMPSEIENYVHRIGRTGRCGKTGVATTFINKQCEESTLLDLKHLLKEAKQRVPPVLLIMDDPTVDDIRDINGVKGCSFCGGLGHRITDCPKLEKDARRVAGGKKDAFNSGDGYGGDW